MKDPLETLRDVHLPPAPAWWAVPEWVFAAAICALLLLLWQALRHRRHRNLRVALRALAALESAYKLDLDTTRLVSGVSRLLRSYAIARFPQAGIEGLTGTAWLCFLDAHGDKGAFTSGAGMVLETRPYQLRGGADTTALLAAVRRWLKANPQ